MAFRQQRGADEFSRPLVCDFGFWHQCGIDASVELPGRFAVPFHPREVFPPRAVARRFIVDERVIRDPMMRRVVGADFVFLSSPRPSMSTAAFAISRTG